MKKAFYTALALFAFAGMWMGTNETPSHRVHAQTASTAPNSIQGDLVIDFMGSIRGYVEPCG